jgi:general secretion pathway protein G
MISSARAASRRAASFTLLELLAVISIIAILAALVIGVGRRAAESGRIARAKAELAAIGAALETYKRTFGDFPRTDDEAQLLQALLGQRGPGSDAAIHGRAVLEPARFTVAGNVLIDPWEQPYVYAYKVPTAGWINHGFVLYSTGPDQSDFSRLTTGGFSNATAPANVDNIHATR